LALLSQPGELSSQDYLRIQQYMQAEAQQFTAVSNILKVRSDSARRPSTTSASHGHRAHRDSRRGSSPERTRSASPVRFEARLAARPPPVPARLDLEPRRVVPAQQPRVDPGAWLGRVAAAQARMDRILAQAASGRTFSPAELLSLQAGVAEASQTVDLAGKVLDRVSGGVKTLLQTQL
jgi:hypothetical protein